jgi:hypothetical protein
MQQESEPSTFSFGDSEPSTRNGPFLRAARAMAARFTARIADPVAEPFRDSDFEADSGYFGRPLGDH